MEQYRVVFSSPERYTTQLFFPNRNEAALEVAKTLKKYPLTTATVYAEKIIEIIPGAEAALLCECGCNKERHRQTCSTSDNVYGSCSNCSCKDFKIYYRIYPKGHDL